MGLALCVAGIAVIAAAKAHAAIERYAGSAYSLSDGRLLYKESHWIYTQAGEARRLVVYSCPDGAAFAHKLLDATAGEATPDFDMLDTRTGYREGVRTHDGHREVFVRTDAQAPERHAELSTSQNSVFDAGFDAYVRMHWDALSAGKSRVQFLIPSRLGYVDFAVRQLHEGAVDGSEVRWFRLALAAWYGFAVPSIDVAYDVNSHQLREYRGVSNIRGSAGNLNVRIDFPPGDRHMDGTLADVQRATALPLTGRCAFR